MGIAHGLVGALPLAVDTVLLARVGVQITPYVTAVLGGAVGVWCARPPGDPRRLRAKRLLTRSGLRAAALAFGRLVGAGTGAGLTIGLIYSVVGHGRAHTWEAAAIGSAAGFSVMLTPSLIVGLSVGARDAPRATATSRQIIRADLAAGLAPGIAAMIPACVLLAFLPGGLAGSGWIPVVSVLLAVGASAALLTSRAAMRYVLYVVFMRGFLPLRPGAFLDWCCASGLMRMAGSAYQFRHREFQQWLARNPAQKTDE